MRKKLGCPVCRSKNTLDLPIRTSHEEPPEEELKCLRKENKSLKASKATLKVSKDKLKAEKKALKAELNKKAVTMATLSKEQKELLSTLFPDIDIRFW